MEAGRLDPKITNVRTSGMYVGAMPSNSNNPFWFITGKTEMNVGSHDHPTYKMVHLLHPSRQIRYALTQGWRDNVDGILMNYSFRTGSSTNAGLFSTIVTAFIVESYRTLKPD